MKPIVLIAIAIIALIATYKLTPQNPESHRYWYESASLFVGASSFFLSLFVVYIAHTVEKHILAKAALNDIRKLHADANRWSLAQNCIEQTKVTYAKTIINAALEDQHIAEHIKEKLRLCKGELDNAQPNPENFLNYLEAVVQRINLT